MHYLEGAGEENQAGGEEEEAEGRPNHRLYPGLHPNQTHLQNHHHHLQNHQQQNHHHHHHHQLQHQEQIEIEDEDEEDDEDEGEDEDEAQATTSAATTTARAAMSPSMVCLSCGETYIRRCAGTCRECYEEATETEEELKKEIEELKARIAFLKTWAPEAMAEDCTDLVLETSDGSRIRAHKAVLVSRSSVFKTMLEVQMAESRSSTIKITDFSYEVLRLFVHYLYTADVYPESLDACAYDLLALAEKYNVKQLKSLCEKYMTSKVNNDNALLSFEYAMQHGAKILREAALSTIIENIHELTAKDEYRELVKRDAKLVVEIFEVYLAKQTNPSS